MPAHPLPLVPCAHCAKPMRPLLKKRGEKHERTRYCSRACGAAHRLLYPVCTCETCGASFQGRSCEANRFCSHECRHTWLRSIAPPQLVYQCKICGKEFSWPPSRVKRLPNITYCSPKCRYLDPATRARLVAMNTDQQHSKQPNHNEQRGYALLESLGVAYLPQALINGKFCVDALVERPKIIVQFDGDYWHAHPERYPVPNAVQRRRIGSDRACDAYLSTCGYRVIRIWERDLRDHPDAVRARLATLIPAG
jgi:very-short-patch-repair endonuclease